MVLKASVVIATVNRQEHLAELLACLDRQTFRPHEVIVSAPAVTDLSADIDRLAGWVTPVIGARGLAVQRNAGMAALTDPDVIFFFDDDVSLREDYIANAVGIFTGDPRIVGLTGTLLLDGAQRGAPVSFAEAEEAIAGTRSGDPVGTLSTVMNLYGCNFAVRASAAVSLRFDEKLPLYSWLEDLDYSRRLAQQSDGEFVRSPNCLAVHHGSASGGREQHRRFGYSQVTNPVHLWRKGSIKAPHAARLIIRPLLANAASSLVGANARWRRARLEGNLLSVSDLLRGRVTPERIINL
jgi:GT2 family glycosyltransferase